MKIMDDKSIRSALVPTPQPAAGWDVRLEARPADGGDWTEIFPAQLNWVVKQGHEVRATEVRREAPAPAEGVKQQSDEVFDIEETRRENADNVRTLDAIAEFVGCPHDEELTVNHVRAHYAARPDTAEARLREALVDLHEAILTLSKFGKNNVTLFEDSPLENQECLDAWLRLNTAQTKAAEVLGPPFKLRFSSGWLASKIKSDPDIETDAGKALSPPSGGDEATESEGGVEGHAAVPLEIPTQRSGESRDPLGDGSVKVGPHREDAVGIKPGPSEPSPPADRREIDPKVHLLLQMIERAKGEVDASENVHSLLNFFCDDRGTETDTYNLAIDAGYLRSSFNDLFETSRAFLTDAGRSILAALDGGR